MLVRQECGCIFLKVVQPDGEVHICVYSCDGVDETYPSFGKHRRLDPDKKKEPLSVEQAMVILDRIGNFVYAGHRLSDLQHILNISAPKQLRLDDIYPTK
jgi:hypothetical protein